MTKNINIGGGIGFFGFLALVFITLKLCHVITWGWCYVLMPIWLPILLVMSFLFICVFALSKEHWYDLMNKWKDK